ncbi:DUF6870 family protein [Anaerotignum sp. MB30-C6]|uniref:DUF6870 family protein n=1 Tax=Anaerotignum sp. MB30-C6 TaxID=3070814 RepID=UPI0027DE2519|nr:hypothetical protein [Anaerotignum sp. MB30-C6]WMI82309.1 hypothetical protein RBQ60_06110 [Anaerotignum sp. MB30-C6]
MLTPGEGNKKEGIDQPTINPDDLVDIRDVVIHTDLPKEERIADFIKQIKNPYLFKCGNMVVECEFSQTEATLSDRLEQYMRMVDHWR